MSPAAGHDRPVARAQLMRSSCTARQVLGGALPHSRQEPGRRAPEGRVLQYALALRVPLL